MDADVSSTDMTGDGGTCTDGCNSLFIGGLSFSSSEDAARSYLQSVFPNASNVRIPPNKDIRGQIKGIAFVEFGSSAEADVALNQANGLQLDDRNLQVKKSDTRSNDDFDESDMIACMNSYIEYLYEKKWAIIQLNLYDDFKDQARKVLG